MERIEARPPMSAHYTYRVTWYAGDNEYVGLCYEFPLLSWLEPTAAAAFAGIRRLVAEVLADMQAAGETPPPAIAGLPYVEQTAAFIAALHEADLSDIYAAREGAALPV